MPGSLKTRNTVKAQTAGSPLPHPSFLLGLGWDQGFTFLRSYQKMLMLPGTIL